MGTTGLEWALDLDFCRLGYSRLSTCRPGEILPQNVSRDEERWAAVFRQVCTVNNKAKHRNGYDLMDLFLQITPKHPAIHSPPPPTKKTMKNTWLPSSKSSEEWIIVDPEAVLSTGYCQLEPNFCMQISKNAGQSQENFSSSSDKLRLSYRVALNLVAKKMIVFVFGSCLQTSQSPRGLVLAILVGVCRPVLQILTLFQTEKSFFLHLFSDPVS